MEIELKKVRKNINRSSNGNGSINDEWNIIVIMRQNEIIWIEKWSEQQQRKKRGKRKTTTVETSRMKWAIKKSYYCAFALSLHVWTQFCCCCCCWMRDHTGIDRSIGPAGLDGPMNWRAMTKYHKLTHVQQLNTVRPFIVFLPAWTVSANARLHNSTSIFWWQSHKCYILIYWSIENCFSQEFSNSISAC